MERAFRGVWITADVYLDKRLEPLDKIILTEIDSLDNEDGCYASNQYLAEFCQCSESKVSKSVSKLLKLGYIRRESFDGRTRILRSNLPKTESLPSKKCQADWQKMPAINIEDKHSSSFSKEKEGAFVKPTLQEVEEFCKEKGYTHFDAEEFFNHYESNGLMVGRVKMKSWHATCSTWERREAKKSGREVTDDASAKFRGL